MKDLQSTHRIRSEIVMEENTDIGEVKSTLYTCKLNVVDRSRGMRILEQSWTLKILLQQLLQILK